MADSEKVEVPAGEYVTLDEDDASTEEGQEEVEESLIDIDGTPGPHQSHQGQQSRMEPRSTTPYQYEARAPGLQGYQQNDNHGKAYNVKPATYDGSTSLENYLTQFELIAELNGWNNYTKAMFLAANLRGEAQGILADIGVQSRRDYYMLVAALKTRFCPSNQHEVFRIQLKNRRRRKDEPIPELGQAIKRLIRQAYPTASTDVQAALSTDHFVDALNDPNLRLGVYQSRPMNIDEAIRAALEMEAFHMAERDRSFLGRKVVRAIQKQDDDNPAEDRDMKETILTLMKEIKELRGKMDQVTMTGRGRRPTRDLSKIQCYNCNEYGHYQSSCTKPKGEREKNQVESPNSDRPKENLSSL